jgi:hypothetical protein
MKPLTDVWTNYISSFEGTCRDCADEGGICPRNGSPCGSDKAFNHAARAIIYGIENGYLTVPLNKKIAIKDRPILIRLTISASLVTKSNPLESTMRHCIERALGECLGRCNWTEDFEFICRADQFGIFMALIDEKFENAELFSKIKFEMFRQGDPKPALNKFNVCDKSIGRLHVELEV